MLCIVSLKQTKCWWCCFVDEGEGASDVFVYGGGVKSGVHADCFDYVV